MCKTPDTSAAIKSRKQWVFCQRIRAHHWHVSAFLCNRDFQGISYYTKNRHTFLYNGLFYISSKLHTEFLLLLSFILLGNNFLLPILNHNLLVKPSTKRLWLRIGKRKLFPEGWKIESRRNSVCSFEGIYLLARWLSWLERRPVTAEVVGSNPIRVV